MKSEHAVTALGLLALVAGLVGFVALNRAPAAVESGVAPVIASAPPEPSWPGVDSSIVRVLTAIGLADVYADDSMEGVPPEVVRVLASREEPIVISGQGESG